MGIHAYDGLMHFMRSLNRGPSKKQRRRDRQRAKRSMRECQFCGKFPLFFHEERPDKWILAEWDETNRPTRHVCKLKERLNSVRFSNGIR